MKNKNAEHLLFSLIEIFIFALSCNTVKYLSLLFDEFLKKRKFIKWTIKEIKKINI